ncbi:hypothetical protein ACVW1C_000991 [Bradyrhizobium sp. USDA 4011]
MGEEAALHELIADDTPAPDFDRAVVNRYLLPERRHA